MQHVYSTQEPLGLLEFPPVCLPSLEQSFAGLDGKVAGLDGKLEFRDAALEKKLDCLDSKLAKMIEESIAPRVEAFANEDKGGDNKEDIDLRLDSGNGELKERTS